MGGEERVRGEVEGAMLVLVSCDFDPNVRICGMCVCAHHRAILSDMGGRGGGGGMF